MADYTSPEDEAFFAAIGRLTVSWAHIEAGLDFGIDVVHHALGGSEIERDAPKTALIRKLKYIRRWNKSVPEPTFRASTIQLMDEIEKASDVRHDLIHGFIVKQAEGSGEAEMIRIVHTAEKSYGTKQYNVTTIEILKAAVAANKLASRALSFGTGLQNLLESLLKKEDKPIR